MISRHIIIPLALCLLANSASPARSDGPEEIDEGTEFLNQLAEPLNRKPSSKIGRAGLQTARMADDMANFYLAVGVTEAWKCFSSRDPTYCKQYIEELKEPSGHVGFVLFMLASGYTSKKLLPLIGHRAGGKMAASFLGMSAGALVNDVFADFANHPLTEQLLETSKITDPLERKKKRSELLKKLFAETFGNKEWALDKIPSIASLLAAAGLSHATSSALRLAATKSRAKIPLLRPRVKSCRELFLRTAAGMPLSDPPGFFLRRGERMLDLLIFLGWAGVLDSPISDLWDSSKISRKLSKSRLQLTKELEDYIANPSPEKMTLFVKTLKERASLHDRKRHHKMLSVEAVRNRHLDEMTRFDQAVAKPYSFYQWFLSGFNENHPTWQSIQTLWYSDKTKPSDIKKEIEKHLRGFFCGKDPSHSFRKPVDLHGVPVPGRFNISVEPFQVISNPDMCRKSHDDLKRAIVTGNTNGEYKIELIKAHAKLLEATHPMRMERLHFYENLIEKELRAVLSEPDGVLTSFEAELIELWEIMDKAKSTDLTDIQDEVDKFIRQTNKKQESARELLAYMETPTAKRAMPEQDF